jgi:hypothetical protein
MPVYGETDEIIIDLTDSKNIHVSEFNRSHFELYLNFTIDLFQGQFPVILPTYFPAGVVGSNPEGSSDWKTIPAFANLAKMTYFFIGFKNSTDCIKYYRITHNGRDIGPTIKDKVQIESYL